MSFVVWDDKYALNIKDIDDDHKSLFDLFDQFHESYATGHGEDAMDPVFKALLDYVDNHFAREEALMERITYPGLKAHKKLHRELKEQVVDYYDRFKKGQEKIGKTGICLEILGFLKNWLHFHILEEDMALRDFINENNIETSITKR